MKFEDACLLVAHVTKNGRSTFYRDLYGMKSEDAPKRITTKAEWEELPFVRKDDLLARRLADRSFIPLSEVDHLRPSSGTSGKGPLFSPRTPLREMEYRLEYHDFKKPILAFTVPAMPHWHEEFQRMHGIRGRTISFDPANPAACARLARDAGVDALSVFAFHVPLIAPHLVREGVARHIRFIEIAGESCSHALYEYIHHTFPNATVLPFYGSSEVEDSPIGMPCRAITGEEPLSIYHAKPSQYLEIIEPESAAPIAPSEGAEGELVISAYPGEPSAFPLLRFRTGDTVRIVKSHCERHGTWTFTLLGRTAMDFIKIPGGVLRADEIERVLRTMPDEVSDRFEVLCTESVGPHGPLIAPTLHVELKTPMDMGALAQRISDRIRISPILTYSQGVEMGRCARLICEEFTPPIGNKTKRIKYS